MSDPERQLQQHFWQRPSSASSMFRPSAGPAAQRPSPQPSSRPAPTVVRSLGVTKPPEIPDFVPDAPSSFSVGDRIEHNRFGKGLILEISGEEPSRRAVVLFENFGQKILMLGHAKLRHV